MQRPLGNDRAAWPSMLARGKMRPCAAGGPSRVTSDTVAIADLALAFPDS
jgi:hypothetical protein